jgi:hypothetical protein
MTDELVDAEHAADLLLTLDGPYHPDHLIEAARTVAELVRRLNHATFSRSALPYPPQLDRVVACLRSSVYGLQQTFGQLAVRLDAFATDPRVGHDSRHEDLAVACATPPARCARPLPLSPRSPCHSTPHPGSPATSTTTPPPVRAQTAPRPCH